MQGSYRIIHLKAQNLRTCLCYLVELGATVAEKQRVTEEREIGSLV